MRGHLSVGLLLVKKVFFVYVVKIITDKPRRINEFQ